MGNCESKESRMASGLTNRSHIRLQVGIRLKLKLKFDNYTERLVVNMTDEQIIQLIKRYLKSKVAEDASILH